MSQFAEDIQRTRTDQILINIRAAIHNNPDLAEPFEHHLNNMLDTMTDNDIFGTEGQLDPRGDKRDG